MVIVVLHRAAARRSARCARGGALRPRRLRRLHRHADGRQRRAPRRRSSQDRRVRSSGGAPRPARRTAPIAGDARARSRSGSGRPPCATCRASQDDAVGQRPTTSRSCQFLEPNELPRRPRGDPVHAQPLGGCGGRAALPARARLGAPARRGPQPALLQRARSTSSPTRTGWPRTRSARWRCPTSKPDKSCYRSAALIEQRRPTSRFAAARSTGGSTRSRARIRWSCRMGARDIEARTLGITRVRLLVHQPGSAIVRVRWTPYWLADGACVERGRQTGPA